MKLAGDQIKIEMLGELFERAHLRKQGCVVVYVLEVDLNKKHVKITTKSLSFHVLSLNQNLFST